MSQARGDIQPWLVEMPDVTFQTFWFNHDHCWRVWNDPFWWLLAGEAGTGILKKSMFVWLGRDRSWVRGWFGDCCSHTSGSDAMCSKNTSGILPICQPGMLGSPQGKADTASAPAQVSCQERWIVKLVLGSSFLGLWLGLPFIFLNALIIL